jgi:hypothetical protein
MIRQLLRTYPAECNQMFFKFKLRESQEAGSKQVNAVSNYKPEKPPIRSAEQTVKLFNQLYGKFPNKKVQIEKLLRTCPAGCNLKFFVAKLDQQDGHAFKKPTSCSDRNRATVAAVSNSERARSVSSSERIRSAEHTMQLLRQLNDKFPNKEGVILKLLDMSPNELNVGFFSSKLNQETSSCLSKQPTENLNPKAKSLERSDEKTFKLFNQLREKFPEKESDILKLMRSYPVECNQTFFWTKLN